MENPNTWGEVEKVIAKVIAEAVDHDKVGELVLGFSLPKRIANALRDAGLLK